MFIIILYYIYSYVNSLYLQNMTKYKHNNICYAGNNLNLDSHNCT